VARVLQQLVAWELERRSDFDDRLGLLTVTDVRVRPDLSEAVVYFASLDEAAAGVLEEHRVALQRAIARGVRLKRTPHLVFVQDEVLRRSFEVDEVLRRHRLDQD
jgi:ribosome-binding factor A